MCLNDNCKVLILVGWDCPSALILVLLTGNADSLGVGIESCLNDASFLSGRNSQFEGVRFWDSPESKT